MSRRHGLWLALGLALVLGACDKGGGPPVVSAAATVEPGDGAAVRLVYLEQEPGIEPYRSRYIVNARYLRIDDEDQNGDFMLFDRQREIIFSISSDNRSVLEIRRRGEGGQPPRELSIHKEQLPLEGAPAVGGREALFHRYAVNGETCLEQVAVPDLAPAMVEALNEFRDVLSGEHRRMVPFTPADMQKPCDLARHAFHPARFMEHGLPLREWDPAGTGRELVSMDLGFDPDPGLFELPAGYRTMTMESLGGGPGHE